MDHVPLSEKYGISKPNRAKKHKKLKKTTRNLALHGPDDIAENFPESGLAVILEEKKKYINPFDCDVASKLLALVSKTAGVSNVHAPKQPFSRNDVRGNTNFEYDLKSNISSTKAHLSNVQKDVNVPTEGFKERHVRDIVNDVKDTSDSARVKDFVQSDGECLVKDICDDKKKRNKDKGNRKARTHARTDVKQCTSASASPQYSYSAAHTQDAGKQESDYTGKPKKKRSSVLKDTLNKQGSYDDTLVDSAVHSNDFSEFTEHIKDLKDSRHRIDNKIKRSSKKRDLSGDNNMFMEENREKIRDETVNSFSSKDKRPEAHVISSVLVKDEPLSVYSKKSEKKHKSSTQKLSVEGKCNDKNKQICSEKSISSSHVLLEIDHQDKKRSKCVSSNNENVYGLQESNISGGWNVMNSEEHEKNLSPLKNVQLPAKKRNKQSENPDIYSHNKQLENVKEKSFEHKKETVCAVSVIRECHEKVAKKSHKSLLDTSQEELCNSQPICVEMSGNNDVASNPFHGQVPNLKRPNATPLFNLKSSLSWKPLSNFCSTEKWEVQYGNTGHLSNTGNEDLEVVKERNEVDRERAVNSAYKKNEISPLNSVSDCSIETVVDHSFGAYNLFHVSETEVILTLSPSSSVFFRGAVKLKVMLGNISVLGFEINDTNSQVYTVYSPYGVSSLGFQACVRNDTFSTKEDYWKLVQERIHGFKKRIKEKILHNIPEFSIILLLESVSETLITFLQKFFPLMHFPTAMTRSKPGEDSSGILRTVFVDQRTEEKIYRQPSAWSLLIPFLMKRKQDELRVLACGGKGVGKSTLLRFLINQTLSTFKEVLYIDFDPGQCEFTIPGCVSAVIVRNPLLGPNYTHLTRPERMVYVGEINVAVCAERYFQSIQHIFDWCCSQSHLANMPWFINTMGFVRGLGLELAVTTIKMVNPSDVIQIESSVRKRNFPFLLKFEEVQNYETGLHSIVGVQNISLNPFSFHEIPSAAETTDNRNAPWGLQANVARETVLLSYISQVIAPPTFSLLEVAPHVVPFAGLKLCISHEKVRYSDYLAAMNADLVGLCNTQNVNTLKPSDPEYPEILEGAPICHCLGFGIVRGVDLEKKVFFIVSPLKAKQMKSVNCLVLGSVHLPESVFTSQDEARGMIPYVVEGALLPLARGVRAAKKVPKLKK